MSTTVARLEAVLSANTRDFDRAMNRSEGKMHKLGNAAKLGGLAVAGGLAVGLEKSVHAAIEAQVSQARLDKAFQASHLSAGKYRKSVEEAEKQSRKLGFTDDDVRKSLGSLLIATGNYRQSLKQLHIAQDLARFKGVDLEQATKALTMAHAGSLRAVKQLGLDVPKVTDAQDRLKRSTKDHTSEAYKNALAIAKAKDKQDTYAKVLDLVAQKTKGQGKAFADTAAGGMAQFHAQVQHVEEVVGTKLLDAFFKTEQWLRQNWPQIRTVFVNTWQAVKPTIMALADLIRSVVTAIRKHWGTIGPIVMGVVAVIRAQLQIVTGVIKFFSAVLRGDWGAAWGALKGIVRGAFNEIKAVITLQITIVKDLAKAIGNGVVAGVRLGLSEGWKLLKAAVTGLFGKVIGWAKEALGIHSPSTVFHGIGRNMVQGMINGVGSMAGLLKKAVVNLAKSAASHFNPFSHGGGAEKSTSGLIPRVVNAVNYARQMGWHGVVTSGFRTYGEQAALYQRYLHGGPLAAPPGHSSHEFGQAVDVTDYVKFGQIMAHAPLPDKLYNKLGKRDPGHFSVSGYAKGGLVGGYGSGDTVPAMLTPGEMVLNRKQQDMLGGQRLLARMFGFADGGIVPDWKTAAKRAMRAMWPLASSFLVPGAPMPRTYFPKPGSDEELFVGATTATPNGRVIDSKNRVIIWPKWMTDHAFTGRIKKNWRDAALMTMVHEWAHAFQSANTIRSEWKAEGGATAFARYVTPKIAALAGFAGYGNWGLSGDPYAPFVNRVKRELGMGWVLSGQFTGKKGGYQSFDNGGWLQPGFTLAHNGTGAPERVVRNDTHGNIVFNFHGPVLGKEQQIVQLFRNAVRAYERNNGRTAFGF